MPKYRLLSQHYSEEDKLLEPGTEVGTGTPHKWSGPPTVEMEGLDREARRLIEAERKRAGEQIDPLVSLPLTMSEERLRNYVQQASAEAKEEEEIKEEAEWMEEEEDDPPKDKKK